MSLPVDRRPVLDEVTAAFEAYEAALVADDTAVLNELFWESPRVVRFGIADAQRGHAELARWRAAQPPVPSGRALARTSVVAFGDDLAVVTTEFSYPGRPAVGRQSQTWVRMSEGWRIVSAHVSEIPVA
ncbi:MAG TPA: oxalurate catabolism protein HpxZ [Acidimicrobiales bacterium]